MIRKQVYLEREQEKYLKRLSQKLGRSEAELIRQAIDRALATDTAFAMDLEAWEREKAFIRKLMAQKPLQRRGRRWTREELYKEER